MIKNVAPHKNRCEMIYFPLSNARIVMNYTILVGNMISNHLAFSPYNADIFCINHGD